MSILFDEYKILQDKIDKIGGFRFTIKGWSVTAVVGALVAIAAGKGFSPSVSSSAVDALLIFFFLFEREQVVLSWKFGNRAKQIELQFDRRRRASPTNSSFSTPGITSVTARPTKRRKLAKSPPKYPRFSKLWKHVKAEVRLARSSDILFYFALGAAAWLPKILGVLPTTATAPATVQNVIQVPAQLPTPVQVILPSSSPQVSASIGRERHERSKSAGAR